MQDDLLQKSVMYCLGQIGEIASNIADEEQEKYPEVFWYQMIGLRNRLFHDYEGIAIFTNPSTGLKAVLTNS